MPLKEADIKQGRILWLPGEEPRKPVVEVATGNPPNPKIYGRPIIVLSRPADNPDMIYFVCSTTFQGKTLTESIKHKGDPRKQEHYIPITTSPQHPLFLNGNALYRNLLLSQGAMQRNSYANALKVFRMEWQHATTKSIRPKLDQASFDRLLELVELLSGFSLGAQHTAPTTSSVLPPPVPDRIREAVENVKDSLLSAHTPIHPESSVSHAANPNIPLPRHEGLAAKQHHTGKKQQVSVSDRVPLFENLGSQGRVPLFPEYRPDTGNPATYANGPISEAGMAPHHSQDVLGETLPLLAEDNTNSSSPAPPANEQNMWARIWHGLVFISTPIVRIVKDLAGIFWTQHN